LGFSGITGEVGSAMAAGRPIEVWKVLVLIGLVWGGIASATTTQFPFSTLDVDLTVYAAVGFLTGFGASAGNGCTSGHGICGLGRLSPRSFSAVCTFVAAASATSVVSIQYLSDELCDGSEPWLAPLAWPDQPQTLLTSAACPVVFLLGAVVVARMAMDLGGLVSTVAHGLVALCGGVTAGFGLVLAGMLDQHKVRGFLNVAGQWDPSLAFVMGSGATISLLAHALANRRALPLLAQSYAFPPACEFGTADRGPVVGARLNGGAALFGIGWGLLGICPGPAVVGLASPLVGGSAPGDPLRYPLFVVLMISGFTLAEQALPKQPAPIHGASPLY